MAGMKKEYNPNRVNQRKRRPVIYIICEGEETEIKYFKHFRSRNCLVEVTPMPSKHKAAEHLVKHARGLIGQAEYRPKDGDEIWCVFDCDDNSNEALKAAADAAEKYDYGIAFSNPCFEYFFVFREKFHLERMNRMKNKPTLWNGVSVLVVAVLVITAVKQAVFEYVPEKTYWPRLTKVFESEGLAAKTTENGMVLSW